MRLIKNIPKASFGNISLFIVVNLTIILLQLNCDVSLSTFLHNLYSFIDINIQIKIIYPLRNLERKDDFNQTLLQSYNFIIQLQNSSTLFQSHKIGLCQY